MSGLYGPNGAQVSSEAPKTEAHEIGGQKLTVFADPRMSSSVTLQVPVGVDPKTWITQPCTRGDLQAVINLVNPHNLYLQCLVRELAALRERVAELEAKAQTVELREPPLPAEPA